MIISLVDIKERDNILFVQILTIYIGISLFVLFVSTLITLIS